MDHLSSSLELFCNYIVVENVFCFYGLMSLVFLRILDFRLEPGLALLGLEAKSRLTAAAAAAATGGTLI